MLAFRLRGRPLKVEVVEAHWCPKDCFVPLLIPFLQVLLCLRWVVQQELLVRDNLAQLRLSLERVEKTMRARVFPPCTPFGGGGESARNGGFKGTLWHKLASRWERKDTSTLVTSLGEGESGGVELDGAKDHLHVLCSAAKLPNKV